MRSIKLCTILILFLALMAHAGTIKGVVTDIESGDPLIGANIILGNTQMGTITDDDGYFILQNVPQGKWLVHANYIGYIDMQKSVIVGSQPVEVTFEMQPTVFKGQEVIVEVNRAEERKTPVTFTEVSENQIQQRYATQDVPDLLKTTPGVFTSTTGLGESEIFIRGFDAERIQILINGVPVNDPESQVVYWSNWTGLSGNASSIQIQRGVGASLLGSGAFGGSVNIVTSKYSATPKFSLRSSVGGYYTIGGVNGTRKVADGTGGADTYNPFNQNISVDYTTGLLYDGKLNLYLKYERKSGDYYLAGTYYNGHSFYLGAQSILGNHILTFNAHGAPQRHNQAADMQDLELLDLLGREYNRYNHPYQENYYFKPQFELHWDWAISDKSYLKTNAFLTFGRGGGRYLRNDYFDVTNGEVGFKTVDSYTDWLEFGRHARFIYETTGTALEGYNPRSNTYTYDGYTAEVTRSRNLLTDQFSHSWRNDSQNNHNQYGINTAYQRMLNKFLTFTIGGEARYWKAGHYAESFDFRKLDLVSGGVKTLNEVQRRYDYDGIVTNLSGFGRLLITPLTDLSLMIDGQYASYSSKVEEKLIRVYDFGAERWLSTLYYPTKDLRDENGNLLFQDSDYERTYSFFMPKFGLNYNFSSEFNAYGNYSISKKEPKTGDWYSRNAGPGVNQPVDASGNPIELDPETLTNIEVGVGYLGKYYTVKANFYLMNFDDKIESVYNRTGDRVTINAGKAEHRGIEVEAHGRWRKFDAMLSGTYSQNRWKEMNVEEIFGEPAEEVVDKVVPFSPERMFHAEGGYNFGPFRFGLGFTYWDRYFGNYTNTAVLPAFGELNANISYSFRVSGADVDLRLDLNNLLSRKNFVSAAWAQDYNRSDGFTDLYMYVAQSPLFYSFFTTQVTL